MNRTYELMFIVRRIWWKRIRTTYFYAGDRCDFSRAGEERGENGQAPLGLHRGRFHDGIYILLTVEGGGGLIHELERRLRVTEPVIKFLTVRIDEEQKRLDKIKAIKDAKRKAAAPVTPAEVAGEAPAATA